MQVYYVTNRAHTGTDRWNPTGYSHRVSSNGGQNLRYGVVSFDESSIANDIQTALNTDVDGGKGHGELLEKHIRENIQQTISIKPFRESADGSKVGSSVMYDQLQQKMLAGADVVVYVHGYNNDWLDAVSAAMSLQLMLNTTSEREVVVVLFTWPSDGEVLFYTPYFSDKADARQSDMALCRALKKLHVLLDELKAKAIGNQYSTWREYMTAVNSGKVEVKDQLCFSDIHLLVHSMGTYVLECALKLQQSDTDVQLTGRMFENVFLCASDVHNSALEPGQPLSQLSWLSSVCTVYFNKNDKPLMASRSTKNFRERLGRTGAAQPLNIDRTFHQVDCTDVVTSDFKEHGYFLNGAVIEDIRQSILGVGNNKRPHLRKGDEAFPNQWNLLASPKQSNA